MKQTPLLLPKGKWVATWQGVCLYPESADIESTIALGKVSWEGNAGYTYSFDEKRSAFWRCCWSALGFVETCKYLADMFGLDAPYPESRNIIEMDARRLRRTLEHAAWLTGTRRERKVPDGETTHLGEVLP